MRAYPRTAGIIRGISKKSSWKMLSPVKIFRLRSLTAFLEMVQKIELYGGAGFYDDLSCQFDVVTWDMRSTATQVITPHGKHA